MADPPAVLRRRSLRLPLATTAPAQRERLEAYLALVDRPLTALLARERLHREAPGSFTYQSNPHAILRWQVVPTLSLVAEWGDDQLAVRSTRCRLAGVGAWGDGLGFGLQALLRAEGSGLAGWAEVGLHGRLAASPIARSLGSVALEAVLDRIERRVHRGLRNDLVAWLGEGGDSTSIGG